jgi:hypothetical protein
MIPACPGWRFRVVGYSEQHLSMQLSKTNQPHHNLNEKQAAEPQAHVTHAPNYSQLSRSWSFSPRQKSKVLGT